jgi:hypothetical protein
LEAKGQLVSAVPKSQAVPGSVLDENASERHLAELLKSDLPPVRCVGEDWLVYENGTWKKKSRDVFKPRALSIQHPKTRTARRAASALEHIEFERQCSEEEFRSFCCFGPSGAILLNCTNGVIGPDLVRHLSLEQICNPQSKLLAQLQRAALNIATELNTIQTVGGETLKQLISGETVQADRKYLSDISLRSACKFWFTTNYLPRFQHGTDAELRRLRFLKFDRKPAKIDPTLKQKLIREQDGIFLFMLDGLRALMKRSHIPNGGQRSLQARERFNIQNGPIGSFVAAECALSPDREVLKDHLFEAYQSFCKRNGIPLSPDNSFFFKELLSRYAVQNIRRRDGQDRVQKTTGIDLRGGG